MRFSVPKICFSIENAFFSGEHCYSASLDNLYRIWKAHFDRLEEGVEKVLIGIMLVLLVAVSLVAE